MLPDLDLLQFLVVLLASFAGALAQSTIGIGFGILMVPVLVIVAPDLLPALPLILATVLSFAIVLRERGDVDRLGLPALFAGRILGTLVAVWLLVSLTGPALDVLFGTVIVIVVIVSSLRPAITPTRTAKVIGGAVSGVFATTAAIGGPPVAVLYSGRPGPEVRSTLGVLFAAGSALSLVALIPTGRLTPGHLLVGLVMLLPTALGFALSGPLASFMEGRWLRPSLLTFAAAGGLLAIVRGVTA